MSKLQEQAVKNRESSNNDDVEVKTLKINSSTHRRLKRHGEFGDTFDDILNRLMDIAEGKRPRKGEA